MSDLSNRLKEAIKASGLSHRELEIKTGVPHSAIQRYASGSTDRVPIGRIELLAKALGVPAEHILGWEEAPKEKDSDSLSEFVSLFQQLTADQKAMIISSMKGILSNN